MCQPIRAVLATILFLGCCEPALAQSPTPASIEGRVVDARTGAGLAKVSVAIAATGAETLTDAEGRFALTGVRPGTVSKCYGQGHSAYGRVAARDFAARLPRGGNNNDIMPADYERLSGSSARHGYARVKVVKV